jgi:tetratricopeptide (TPR) repeat protein
MADGKIVTFYSYKGGAGRTMALANVAWILASSGLKVLMVDWDLDSPGLHKYFHPFLDPAKIAATPGVIDLISDYAWEATGETDRPDDWYLKHAQVLRHAVSVNWTEFPDGGTLDFVSAGRQNRDYSSAVASVDWDNFYDRLGGGPFFDALRANMKANYDYTLIDSRTGLSDIADICTVHFPDVLVDCFTLSDQSIDGAAAVARSIDQRYHYRKIRVLPVAMRVDDAEKEKLDVGRALARAKFAHFPSGVTEDEAARYWASVEIPYKPFYAYEEVLAVFGDAPGSPLSLVSAYERLTAEITERAVPSLQPMSEEVRLRYREAFVRRRRPVTANIRLSYVPEDQMWADWITAVLAQHGVRVRSQVAAGTAANRAQQDAQHEEGSASRTVAVVSAAYLRSPQARAVWEEGSAFDPDGINRRIIAVRVGEVRMTAPFAEQMVVDLIRRDAASATEELLKALGNPQPSAGYVADPGSRTPRYPRTIPEVWNVPARNAVFTGRSAVLETLREQLVGSSRAVVLPLALYGLGGVGKTQIALEYAHRFMADYDAVWWLSAERRDLINPAFAELAKQLGIRVGESIDPAAEAARETLRRGYPYARWLLIFDNADDPAEIEPFMPSGPGHILVTSRNPAWSRVAEPIEVDLFARQESQEHLQRRVPGLSDSDASMVAEALGDLPLAIEQAGAWLAETGMPATAYVEQLEREFARTAEPGQPPYSPRPVAVTWRLSFDRLRAQSPAAARLLELCSFFAPEPISIALLYSDQMIEALVPYDKRLRERIILGQLFREITRYSLARVDRGSNTIQVHRLIQGALRGQMRSPREREEVMHEVHRILVGARPRQGDTDDPENWYRYDWIWPHLEPSQAYRCDEEETRQLLIDRVRYLWTRGDYEEALQFGRRLEELWRERLGPDDRQTLRLRFHIANVLRSQGRYAEALEQDTEILAKQRAVLTEYHPYTLQTAGSLAGDLRGLGEFRRALETDSETYNRFKDLFGEDDPSTLSAANNLAIDLRLVGDCFRARELDQDTLTRRQVVLGASHPYSLHSASMLARDIRDVGDFAGSVELLREIYQRYLAVLGEDFIDTLSTAKSLAVSLRKRGLGDEAYTLTRDTCERYARNHSPDHPDALACQLNLACDLSARDDKKAAHAVATDVFGSYERTLGPEHPFTLLAANNLSTYLRGMGSADDSLELAESALLGFRGKLGDDHAFSLSCAINTANSQHDVGRLDAAEALLRDTGNRLKRTLGESHPDSLVCQANLAIVLRARGRGEDAVQLQQEVIAMQGRTLGDDHPNIAALRRWRLQDRDLESQPT